MRRLTPVLLAALLVGSASVANAGRWLLVGGGPAPQHNEASIELNTEYVLDSLGGRERRVLFADGTSTTPHIEYRDSSSGARRLRPARLAQLDGPATEAGLDVVWQDFAGGAGQGGLVVYFAGHGVPSRGFSDNRALLWAGDDLSVSELAGKIEALPPATPVVLLMAQCFSGGFGNALFAGADPKRGLAERDIVGFFAAPKDRPSSGCTPELDESTYDDFTTHFFGALTGVDRHGEPRGGADYDGSGVVGMNEAFAHTLVASDSIDVPVATSDVFLRHYVDLADSDAFATIYSEVYALATPAQRAALDGLSHQLGAYGEDRLLLTYEHFRQQMLWPASQRDAVGEAKELRLLRLAKSIVLRQVLLATRSDVAHRLLRLEALEAANPLGREERWATNEAVERASAPQP